METGALGSALDIRSDEGTRDHVHGFHSYPARMHPITARRLIEQLSPPEGVLLDPFCGSGTVLVEGLLAGRQVIGVDANPLAIELAWLKTRTSTDGGRREILEGARAAVAFADERRKRRSGATHRYGAEDVSLFDPHVLLELDGLRAGLARMSASATKRALFLVLSSILVKVSRRPGDTAPSEAPRRLASGFTIRLFLKKTEELDFFGLGGFEELGPFEDFYSARAAGGAAAGKGNRSRGLVTNVDQGSAFGHFDHGVPAKDVSLEMDRGHEKRA